MNRMGEAGAVAAGRFRRTPAERSDQRLSGERSDQASHLYARWVGWAFDHSGWHPEHEVVEVNAQFERRPVTGETATFCRRNHLRTTDRFWADPRPRALAYVDRFEVPWHRDPRA